MGPSKSGKTTFISALTNCPDKLIAISADNKTRTKITVEYHLSFDEPKDDLIIEDIDYSKNKIISTLKEGVKLKGRQNNQGKDSLEVKYEKMKEILKFDQNLISDSNLEFDKNAINSMIVSGNIDSYIEEKFKSFCGHNNISLTGLQTLFSSEYMDSFIKRITLKVPAKENLLKEAFENHNIKIGEKGIHDKDIYIRDTRGLLDVVKDEPANGQVKNVEDLGLENLDAVLFFCSGGAYYDIFDIYKELLTTIFKAIPVFLFIRDDGMYENYEKQKEIVNQNYNEKQFFLDVRKSNGQESRNDAIGVYCTLDEKYQETLEFFSEQDLAGYNDEQDRYFLKNNPFSTDYEIEFIVPKVSSIRPFKNSMKSKSDDIEQVVNKCKINVVSKKDFLFLQQISILSFVETIYLTFKYRRDEMEEERENLAENARKAVSKLFSEQYNDNDKYGIRAQIIEYMEKPYKLGPYIKEDGEKYEPILRPRFRPQGEIINQKEFNALFAAGASYEQIYDHFCGRSDKKIDILIALAEKRALKGIKGGITTKSNGRYSYPHTLFVGVSSYRFLLYYLSKELLKKDAFMPPSVADSEEKKSELLSHIYYFTIYRHFTDTYASCGQYYLVKREEIIDAIERAQNAEINAEIMGAIEREAQKAGFLPKNEVKKSDDEKQCIKGAYILFVAIKNIAELFCDKIAQAKIELDIFS